MFKKLIALAMAVVMAAALLSGCGQSKDTAQNADKNEKLKVGFVFIGPLKDGGYTEAHSNGMEYMKEKMGDKVEVFYKESVPEGPDSEKAIRELVDLGCKLIFSTSFGYMDYTAKVAKEYPDVIFEHCSGYTALENMGNYFGRMYEPRYLSGIVAGLKTKSNKIGYVGAFDFPEVISGINAFTLGVQSVNPDAKVVVKWINTWYDPAKEKDAAEALLDEGCDVITQHTDTTGPQVAAENRGAFAIGYDIDHRTAAPKAYLTAPIWEWGTYYLDRVEKVLNGTWKSEAFFGGMNDGTVALAELTDIAPAEAKTKVAEMEKKIRDGSFHVFQGPIKDQSGAIKIAEGEKASDEDILTMKWFVEGVEGKIGQ